MSFDFSSLGLFRSDATGSSHSGLDQADSKKEEPVSSKATTLLETVSKYIETPNLDQFSEEYQWSWLNAPSDYPQDSPYLEQDQEEALKPRAQHLSQSCENVLNNLLEPVKETVSLFHEYEVNGWSIQSFGCFFTIADIKVQSYRTRQNERGEKDFHFLDLKKANSKILKAPYVYTINVDIQAKNPVTQDNFFKDSSSLQPLKARLELYEEGEKAIRQVETLFEQSLHLLRVKDEAITLSSKRWTIQQNLITKRKVKFYFEFLLESANTEVKIRSQPFFLKSRPYPQ
jgi:hypothetical protein